MRVQAETSVIAPLVYEMGAIVSLVTGVINLAKNIKVEVDREKNRGLQKEAARLSNPIKPPQPWPTLEARRKNVKNGPYSVEGIRESLQNLVLPAGWSEEQLINVGFEDEVGKYRNAVDADRRSLLSSFGQTLAALAHAVETELTGADMKLRQALNRAGVTRATVARFNNLSREATVGKLEPSAVSSAISELRTLLDKTQLEKEIATKMQDSQKQLAAASDARNGAMLGLLRRALNVHLPTG